MQARSLALALLLGALAPSVHADDLPRLPAALLPYYRAIQPREDELRWQAIPWLQDLDSAVVQARKEKRPLFLWVAGDEPLQRC
jgi:hypothetical protein